MAGLTIDDVVARRRTIAEMDIGTVGALVADRDLLLSVLRSIAARRPSAASRELARAAVCDLSDDAVRRAKERVGRGARQDREAAEVKREGKSLLEKVTSLASMVGMATVEIERLRERVAALERVEQAGVITSCSDPIRHGLYGLSQQQEAYVREMNAGRASGMTED